MFDNWISSAVANGIGGVNCGGIEGDVQFRDNHSTIVNNVKILDWLILDENIVEAIDDGYLTATMRDNPEEKVYLDKSYIVFKDAKRNLKKEKIKFQDKFMRNMEKLYPIVRFDNFAKDFKKLDPKEKETPIARSMLFRCRDVFKKYKEIKASIEKIKKMEKQANSIKTPFKSIQRLNISLTDLAKRTYSMQAELGCSMHYKEPQ